MLILGLSPAFYYRSKHKLTHKREKIDYKELLVKVAWFYLLTHVLNDKIVTALGFRKTTRFVSGEQIKYLSMAN